MEVTAEMWVKKPCKLCNFPGITYIWVEKFQTYSEINTVSKYSKTYLKWPLKIRQNKDLNDKW